MLKTIRQSRVLPGLYRLPLRPASGGRRSHEAAVAAAHTGRRKKKAANAAAVAK